MEKQMLLFCAAPAQQCSRAAATTPPLFIRASFGPLTMFIFKRQMGRFSILQLECFSLQASGTEHFQSLLLHALSAVGDKYA